MTTKLCLIALWVAIPAFAQQSVHSHPETDSSPAAVSSHSGRSPYAGMQTRAVKALSAQ